MKQTKITPDFKRFSKNTSKTGFIANLSRLFQKKETTNISKVVKKSFQKQAKTTRKQNSKIDKKDNKSGALVLNILGFLLKLLCLPFVPFFLLFKFIFNILKTRLVSFHLIKIAFIIVFLSVALNFARLQILTLDQDVVVSAKNINFASAQIIPSRRGQIYIQDIRQGENSEKRFLPVTATQNVADLVFNPYQLKVLLGQGVSIEEVAQWISASLNLSYTEVLGILKDETSKPEPRKYAVIKQFIDENQKEIVEYLKINPDSKKLMLTIGLGIEEKGLRSYPEGQLMANTVGYVSKYSVDRATTLNTVGCKDLVLENERRNTVNTFSTNDKATYTVGYYGLEQKFCSVLAGLNGRKQLNNEVNSSKSSDSKVANGADVYTTIDKNLQFKTEQILQQAIEQNKNGNGAPKNGTAIAMEVKTGKILSMASSPTFNPEEYNKFNPESYRNVASSVAYDIGSVMKPLTFAAALNTYQLGKTGSKGQRLGVPPDFTFVDYDARGKIYTALDGTQFPIQNSKGKSYQSFGKLGLEQCILYSINTCTSDIVDSLGNVEMRYYLEEVYGLGRPIEGVNLPGDYQGDTRVFAKEINCPSCYARYGFGQGFSISPLQLLRAYTAIANNGTMVEPYLVEKINYPDGTIDDGSDPDSKIKRALPRNIIKESAARLVTSYMVNLIVNTEPGVGANKAKVDGYTVACKTGTAEKITRENGKTYGYAENRARGLYMHTMVCFNANSDNPILFLIKIDEPKPGEISNFSGDTIGPSISEFMKYTFDYLAIKNK